MLWNAMLLALRAIRRNLLRSFLTVLGIVIGVAAVIAMVTLGNGATQVGLRPDREHGQQPAGLDARASASVRAPMGPLLSGPPMSRRSAARSVRRDWWHRS